jgi:hypothetical protein
MLVLAISFLIPSLAVIGYAIYIRFIVFAQYFEPIVLKEAWTSDLQRRRGIRVLTIKLLIAGLLSLAVGTILIVNMKALSPWLVVGAILLMSCGALFYAMKLIVRVQAELE